MERRVFLRIYFLRLFYVSRRIVADRIVSFIHYTCIILLVRIA